MGGKGSGSKPRSKAAKVERQVGDYCPGCDPERGPNRFFTTWICHECGRACSKITNDHGPTRQAAAPSTAKEEQADG